MGNNFLAGIQGIPDFGHGIAVMMNIRQGCALVRLRNVVNPLPTIYPSYGRSIRLIAHHASENLSYKFQYRGHKHYEKYNNIQ